MFSCTKSRSGNVYALCGSPVTYREATTAAARITTSLQAPIPRIVVIDFRDARVYSPDVQAKLVGAVHVAVEPAMRGEFTLVVLMNVTSSLGGELWEKLRDVWIPSNPRRIRRFTHSNVTFDEMVEGVALGYDRAWLLERFERLPAAPALG